MPAYLYNANKRANKVYPLLDVSTKFKKLPTPSGANALCCLPKEAFTLIVISPFSD